MSNILYVSCHSSLEWDEIRLLSKLGHQIFSCGTYFDPLKPTESLRTSIQVCQNKDWKNIFEKTKCKLLQNGSWYFSKEFISLFDSIIFMHSYQSIISNMRVLSGKKIFWRTIGQSNFSIEKVVSKYKSDIKIIRYSEKESETKGFCGQDYLIRFYKDKRDYLERNKQNDKICCFYNSFHERSSFFNREFYDKKISKKDHAIFGRNNVTDIFKGEVSFEKQKEILSTWGANYIINTRPANYTLSFVEGLASGIPIIIDGEDDCDERLSLLGSEIFKSTDMSEQTTTKKIELQNICYDKYFSFKEIAKQWNSIGL